MPNLAFSIEDCIGFYLWARLLRVRPPEGTYPLPRGGFRVTLCARDCGVGDPEEVGVMAEIGSGKVTHFFGHIQVATLGG